MSKHKKKSEKLEILREIAVGMGDIAEVACAARETQRQVELVNKKLDNVCAYLHDILQALPRGGQPTAGHQESRELAQKGAGHGAV